ncbi:MAG: translation initiation factor 2 [Lachnospiraceae bacterium]|nr:translation initiation factor 2 [Lachnospiraceae bacterium]
MKGKHRIIIQNKRIRYDFIIKRNITIIRGDSATGKTTLVDLVREHFENHDASAVELACDKSCAVIEGRTWSGQLSMIRDSIVFIDEGNDFVMTDEFAAVIQSTDNYYVIVTREGIPSLPYSVNEIYGIRNSGKYGTIKRTYNEFYHLYATEDFRQSVKPQKVITEDSNSGYQFFENVCKNNGEVNCVSAQGKSNIFAKVVENPNEKILVIADGAAFGSEMDKLMKYIQDHPVVTLYLPESFEWLILRSGLLEDNSIRELLNQPENLIASETYFSWERYFTAQLIEKTKGSYLQYTKRQLNPVYLQNRVKDKILEGMNWIEL